MGPTFRDAEHIGLCLVLLQTDRHRYLPYET